MPGATGAESLTMAAPSSHRAGMTNTAARVTATSAACCTIRGVRIAVRMGEVSRVGFGERCKGVFTTPNESPNVAFFFTQKNLPVPVDLLGTVEKTRLLCPGL